MDPRSKRTVTVTTPVAQAEVEYRIAANAKEAAATSKKSVRSLN